MSHETSEINKALTHLKKMDSKIYAISKTVDYEKWFSPWERMRSSEDHFDSLCGIIIGQQLSTKVADSIYKRFEELFKGKITPEKLLTFSHDELRAVGLSNAKVKYLQDLSSKVVLGELNLAKLESMPEEELMTELIKVKGLGPWSVEMFLIFSLGRENVFSFGDLGLLRGIERVYGLENPSKTQIEEIISKWSPYKSFGSIALWHSLS